MVMGLCGLGFRNLLEVNLAMVGTYKVGISLTTQTVLEARDFFSTPHGLQPKLFMEWNLDSIALTVEGCRWRIGDGNTQMEEFGHGYAKEDNFKLETPRTYNLAKLKIHDLWINPYFSKTRSFLGYFKMLK